LTELNINIIEPLEESAPVIKSYADRHCLGAEGDGTGCRYYHGFWQYLRLLGLTNSLSSSAPHFLQLIDRFVRGRSQVRVLISGSADYSMLAHLNALFSHREISAQITLVDRCSTPLFANRWYSQVTGVDVFGQESDIFELQGEAEFDLICTHSFLQYFSAPQRIQLVKKWYSLLVNGGSVITSQRVRPVMKYADNIYEKKDVEKFVAKVLRAYDEKGGLPDMGRDEVERAARNYVSVYKRHPIRSFDDLQHCFSSAGFELVCFEPERQAFKERLTSGPENPDSVRYAIEAKKTGSKLK
jgi:hypothetical protein